MLIMSFMTNLMTAGAGVAIVGAGVNADVMAFGGQDFGLLSSIAIPVGIGCLATSAIDGSDDGCIFASGFAGTVSGLAIMAGSIAVCLTTSLFMDGDMANKVGEVARVASLGSLTGSLAAPFVAPVVFIASAVVDAVVVSCAELVGGCADLIGDVHHEFKTKYKNSMSANAFMAKINNEDLDNLNSRKCAKILRVAESIEKREEGVSVLKNCVRDVLETSASGKKGQRVAGLEAC
jgi:hypothetical protein